MARHEKQSEEEFEDHGVLDTPAADTTALNALGLPTEQVRINLPRGYEDLDDEGVVDDGPEPLSGGSIVLELPDHGAEHPVGHVTRPSADVERDESVEDESESDPDESVATDSDPDESDADPDEPVEPDAGPDDSSEHDASDPGHADGGGLLGADAEQVVQESGTGDSGEHLATEPAETESSPVAVADVAEPDEPADESDTEAESLDVAEAGADGGAGTADMSASDEADPSADADDSALEAEQNDAGTTSEDGEQDEATLGASDAAGQEPDLAEDEALEDAGSAPLDDAAPAREVREDVVDHTELDEIAGTTNESATAPAATDDATEAEPMASTDAPSASNGPSTRFVSQSATGQRGGSGGESANQLTSDRLIESSRRRVQPEGAWRGFFYRATGGLINLGDSRKVRRRKELTARIAAPLPGRARFVPVLSRKGGVGKTTVTTLLGMALADGRDDRVVAVDANPDRGTLAERVATRTNRTVRDVVRRHDRIRGYADITDLVARDSTRLDIVASETDPHIADAFDDADYRTVAEVASQYYSLVLTDTGTGIIHAVMGATLDMADQLVVVAGPSVDESRLASETLTWLEAHGHEDLVRGAVVVLNQSAPGRSLVRLDELETHFASRVRAVVRLPYDENLATGGAVAFADLRPGTRRAAREAAAHVIEGMRSAALHSVGDEA
ncbi:MinD/ParA family ATP-binding protein [Microbacterium halotolerans]|uniref:MinD/ParA family ATP-binding protein n=1 Tax=Microbacterium halotolerans TaxID=246613 RepID=UPI001F08AC2D|nr:MinD/ParA family protein [Microbacterium halotolerans]